MRDRGANGPRDRGNKEASNAAVSARRTGSQEPKAAFSLFVLSFLYSLLTDSARQARGQKLGARSFFPVPCPLVPVPLFPWSLPGPRRQVFVAGVACSLLFPHPLPPAPTPSPLPLQSPFFCSSFPCSLGPLFPVFYPPPHEFRPPPPMPFCETVKL